MNLVHQGLGASLNQQGRLHEALDVCIAGFGLHMSFASQIVQEDAFFDSDEHF